MSFLEHLGLVINLQPNDFFMFGESYAGKYIPSLGRYIHDQNVNDPNEFINLKGMGIGHGDMDPYNMDIYGEYLYQVQLIYTISL